MTVDAVNPKKHGSCPSSFSLSICFIFFISHSFILFHHFRFHSFMFISSFSSLSVSFFHVHFFFLLASFHFIPKYSFPASLSSFLFLLAFQLGLRGLRPGRSPSMYLQLPELHPKTKAKNSKLSRQVMAGTQVPA